MGDPQSFQIKSGSNPHTRTRWGIRKKVNQKRAIQQWHSLARKVTELGAQVLVMPPVKEWPGTVYPANAGFLYQGRFYLSNLVPGREGERACYQGFLQRLGFTTQEVPHRFEGEADFFPVGDSYLFTYGDIKEQRFVVHPGIPPWKRVYGFRSDPKNVEFLQSLVAPRKVISIELTDEAYYHGDTVLCSFGPRREFLSAYLSKIDEEGVKKIEEIFGNKVISLSDQDGGRFAANSFYTETERGKFLVMPQGLSRELLSRIESIGVTPVAVDVSEFMDKGGGSVKCMVCGLGLVDIDDSSQTEEVREFRKSHLY